jgi:hypothetical protein
MSRAFTTSKKLKGFSFEELSDAAKETAREWWRSCNTHDDGWYEPVQEDAIKVFALFGFSVEADDIAFSGFSSQGDGASFDGSYIPPEIPVVKAIEEHAPKDETLKGLAGRIDVLQTTLQLRWNASFRCRFYRMGRHFHSGCMQLDEGELRPGDPDDFEDRDHTEDEMKAIARGLADWLYSNLEAESEYLQSDEVIDEALAGSYRFDELGHII